MTNKLDGFVLDQNCLKNLTNYSNELFSIFPFGILITFNDEVIYLNKAFSAMLKITDKKQVVDNEDIDMLTSYSGPVNKAFEYEIKAKNKPSIWVEVLINKQVLSGNAIYKIYTLNDITKIKRSNKKNQESNKQFKAIFEESSDAIAMHNYSDVVQINSAFITLFGLRSRNEAIGKNITDYIDKSERERIERFIEERLKGINSHKQYVSKGLRSDGSAFDIDVTVSTYDMKDEKIGVVTIKDITKKLEAEKAVIDSNNKLKKSLLAMVSAIVQTMEARDPFTAGHQQKVAIISEAIGIELGFSSFRLEGLVMGAKLHDIGSLNIPIEIMIKKTELSELEHNLIKEHSQKGAQMLGEVDFPWPIRKILLEHHERVNGSGYPCGLKGNEMALESRIVAVADVFDAMSSDRPYREALGKGIALEELKRNKGVLYDTGVVEAVIKLVEEDGHIAFD